MFEVVGFGEWPYIEFDFDPFYGSILQLDPVANPPLGMGPGIAFAPEPTTAVLVGLGLIGLGFRSRHQRD